MTENLTALQRRNWPTAPDGFHIAVPTNWQIPGAGPISTSSNPNLEEGRLLAEKREVAQLARGAAELPESALQAQGPVGEGTAGVAVGVFDVGIGALQDLRAALQRTLPDVTIEEVTVSRLSGLKVTDRFRRPDPDGRHIVSDYWVMVPRSPGQVALVRFWLVSPADEVSFKALEQFMIGSFSLILPAHWSGLQRRASLFTYRPGGDEPTDRAWRLGGWRLGATFKTAPLSDNLAASLSRVNARPSQVGGLVLIYLAWLAATMVAIGFENGVIIGGTTAFAASVGASQKVGRKATVGLVVALLFLLVVGVSFDAASG